jgi:hypothetical protein
MMEVLDSLMGLEISTRRWSDKPVGNIQGVFEMCAEILTTSYWLHVELGKNI